MAVSGLHAIILSLFVYNVLFFMKGRLIILRTIITIVILWSFAFVTGLTPSVLRATMMYSFLQSGKLLKRPANGINSVLASAFFLIVNNPSVIFDAGFLLSYSAVIYIICFYNNFYLILHFKNWIIDKIWQSVAVTIIAQAGTLPLTIMLFNRFPTYFILANITIVPLSNLLIITGCLVPVFFPVHFISQFLARFLSFLTGLTESLTSTVASLPYSTIENIGSTALECILLTITIFLITYYLLKKKSIPLIYPVIFLSLFVLAYAIRDISSRTSNELIVYNTPGSSTIGIKTGKILNLYSDSSVVVPDVKRHCATLGLKIRPVRMTQNFYCLRAGGKNILITGSLNSRIIQSFIPDILILTNDRPGIENNPKMEYHPGIVIISSVSNTHFHVPSKTDFSGIDSVYLVGKSGAFMTRI